MLTRCVTLLLILLAATMPQSALHWAGIYPHGALASFIAGYGFIGGIICIPVLAVIIGSWVLALLAAESNTTLDVAMVQWIFSFGGCLALGALFLHVAAIDTTSPVGLFMASLGLANAATELVLKPVIRVLKHVQ